MGNSSTHRQIMNQEKNRINWQWLMLSTVLAIVILIMLFNFSMKTSLSAQTAYEQEMLDVVTEYAEKMNIELDKITAAGTPVAKLLATEKLTNELRTKMLLSVKNYTNAEQVLLCQRSGAAVDETAKDRNIRNKSYYTKVLAAYETTYIFANAEENDGESAIISAIPIGTTKDDVLLIYYPADRLNEYIKPIVEFGEHCFYTIVDAEDNTLLSFHEESKYLQNGKLWDNLKEADTTEIAKVRNRLHNGNSGVLVTSVEGDEKALVYVSTGINGWSIVVGVNKSFVDKRSQDAWKDIKSMLYELLAVVAAFLMVVLILNLISKYYNAEKNRELQEKADTDLLTGLNNKLATERKIKEYMEMHPEAICAMFVLDIDNFKKINDTMGHAFGDQVLRSFGNQICSIFRVSDIVGRTGGDEFIIFLKNLPEEAQMYREAEKLTRFFEGFTIGEYVKYSATASIGAAVFSKDGKDFESLYKSADNALYKAKKRGKNQIAYYRDRAEDTDKDEKSRVGMEGA